jgi:long-chain acyl-CoA synthetase
MLGDGGDATAFLAFDGEQVRHWSFSEFHSAVEHARSALLRLGAQRGDLIGIYAPNSPDWAAVFLAAISIGAIAMPLDERTEESDIARCLTKNRSKCIATTARHAVSLRNRLEHGQRLLILDPDLTTDAVTSEEHELVVADTRRSTRAQAQDIAVLLHTSGTTGTPKAVPLTHANLISNIAALHTGGLINERDRILVPLPFHHVYPLTVGLLAPMTARSAIVIPSGLSGPELIRALRDGAATHLLGVPRLYEKLLEAIEERVVSSNVLKRGGFAILRGISSWSRRRLGMRVGRVACSGIRRQLASRLRVLVSGGATLEASIEEKLEDLGWDVLTGYGLTETSPILTFNRPSAKRAGSVGLPLAGTEVRIADPDTDGIGQIEVHGPSVFAGYRDAPESTANALTLDGWFRTGDLGYRDPDGFLYIVARSTETIVLPNGKKVFPETIEERYSRSPLISELAVLQHNGTLVALVVPSEEALRARGTERLQQVIHEDITARAITLPPHERLSGLCLTRSPLPRTYIGKLKRHLLEPLYIRACERKNISGTHVPSEKDLALLKIPAAARLMDWLQRRFPNHPITLDTSPQIDLGLDSLSWVDVTMEMDRALGITLIEAAISRVVTVRDLLHEAISAMPHPPPDTSSAPVPSSAQGRAGMYLISHWIITQVNRTLMRCFFRLRIRGLDNLPSHGPLLFCPNHVSYLDPFAIAAALPYRLLRHTWWAGWTALLFAGPLSRAFSRLVQVVPVDPDRGVMSGLAGAASILDGGRSLVWFPEGMRSYDGRLQGFMPGIGALIALHPVPVIPVAVSGTFEAWPRRRRFPRLHPVTVSFGVPMVEEAFIAGGQKLQPPRIAGMIRDKVTDLLEMAQ